MRKALYLLLLASCTRDLTVFDQVDVATGRDLDVLFVVDTSSDRANYDVMASQIDVLEARLTEIDGQVPNLRIGVVTSDLGVRGTEDALPVGNRRACGGSGDGGKLTTFFTPLDRAFIVDNRGPDGTRVRNFTTDLEVQLGLVTNPAAVKVGCEVQQPLEAMRLALDPTVNPGFLRDNAMLQVIFLTNDDDCSLLSGALIPANNATGAQPFACTSEGIECAEDVTTPGNKTSCVPREDSTLVAGVQGYIDFLEGLKANPLDVTVSAVVGVPDEVTVASGPLLSNSCDGAAGTAKPAVRLAAVVDAFGGALVDSCTQTDAYDQIATPLVLVQSSCLPNLLATDPVDCEVDEIIDAERSAILSCDASDPPCFIVYTDEASCPDGDNVGIQIDRGLTTAPDFSRIEARCFLPE